MGMDGSRETNYKTIAFIQERLNCGSNQGESGGNGAKWPDAGYSILQLEPIRFADWIGCELWEKWRNFILWTRLETPWGQKSPFLFLYVLYRNRTTFHVQSISQSINICWMKGGKSKPTVIVHNLGFLNSFFFFFWRQVVYLGGGPGGKSEGRTRES